MYFKKVIATLISVFLFLNISACNTESNKKNVNKGIAASDTKKVGTDGIQRSGSKDSLFVSHVSRKYLSSAVEKFKDNYKNVEIEEKTFTLEQAEEYRNKMTVAILTGEGPDIIDFNEYFPFNTKYFTNGVLYDINSLISEDSTFNLNDYNQTVLDTGLYDGKRYVIPCGYTIPMLYTVNSELNNEIDWSNWDWNAMISTAKKFASENMNSGKYFFSPSLTFTEFVKYSGLDLIDYKNKKSSFSSPDFVKLLKSYKEILPAICPDEVNKKYRGNIYNMMKDGVIQFIYVNKLASVYELWGENSAVHDVVGQDMEIYPFPSPTGERYGVSQAHNMLGISSNSKKPEAAFDYIKILLSYDLQKKIEENYNSPNFSSAYRAAPVLKNIFQKEAEYFMRPEIDSGGKKILGDKFDGFNDIFACASYSLTQKLVNQLNEELSGVTKCFLPENTVYDFIQKELPDFLSGKKTAEQTAKAINNKVNLYLNE